MSSASSSAETVITSSENPFFAVVGRQEDSASSSSSAASYAAVVSGKQVANEGPSGTSVPPTVELTKGPHNAKSKNPFFSTTQSDCAPSLQGRPAPQVGVVSQVPTKPTFGSPPRYDSQAAPGYPFLPPKPMAAHLDSRPRAPGNPFFAQKPVAHNSVPPDLASTGTILHLKGVAPPVNNKEFLLRHFSRFGEVESVNSNIKKMCANVSFKTHVSIRNAALNLLPHPIPVLLCMHCLSSEGDGDLGGSPFFHR